MTKKFGIIGNPIKHSLSPILHNYWFKKYNIDCIAIEILNTSNREIETQNQNLDFIFKSNVFKLLKKNNYKLINWVNSDLVFVNKKFKI